MLTRVYGTAFFKKKDLTSTSSASSRPARATTAGSARSSGCSRSPTSRRARRSGCQGHDALQLARRAQPPHAGASAATSRSRRRSSTSRRCARPAATGASTRRTCSSREYEGREFALKPMNCPGHCHLFGLQRWSYRDLPYRCAEPGLLHRREPSGTLHGLLRVRHFCQDDAHIFCREDQVHDEVAGCLQFGLDLYGLFGLRSSSSSRRGRTTGSAATSSGTRPRGCSRRRCEPAATSTGSPRARAPSTRRRSTCT